MHVNSKWNYIIFVTSIPRSVTKNFKKIYKAGVKTAVLRPTGRVGIQNHAENR